VGSPVDVLVPTYRRPAALAVTLSGLAAQTVGGMRVLVSDHSPDGEGAGGGEIEALVRILRARGHAVERRVHLPRRGLAEHRQALLDRVVAPYALFLDDDVWLEPDLVERLLRAIRDAACGFVGSAVVGLSFTDDERPEEQPIEFWDGPPQPERVSPESPAWQRHRLHNAANLHHLRERLRPERDRLYRVAWVGGCVLYDARILRRAGGFGFWRRLPPEHAGEDVLAQLRVMAMAGGAGLFPSGAYHLELPTTIEERQVDAPVALWDVP
jgi:GT2 family glycosyltransferase